MGAQGSLWLNSVYSLHTTEKIAGGDRMDIFPVHTRQRGA